MRFVSLYCVEVATGQKRNDFRTLGENFARLLEEPKKNQPSRVMDIDHG
jgi:hypothetical protein